MSDIKITITIDVDPEHHKHPTLPNNTIHYHYTTAGGHNSKFLADSIQRAVDEAVIKVNKFLEPYVENRIDRKFRPHGTVTKR